MIVMSDDGASSRYEWEGGNPWQLAAAAEMDQAAAQITTQYFAEEEAVLLGAILEHLCGPMGRIVGHGQITQVRQMAER